MKKSINVLALTTALTGLCAGAALAGTIGNATVTTVDPNTGASTTAISTTPQTIATEKIAVSGLTAPDATKVFYQSTANFVPNDVITFNFSNVAFVDTVFSLCDDTTGLAVADYIGNIDPTNGVASLVFRANSQMPLTNAGDFMYIANVCDAAGTAYTDPTAPLTPKFPALAAGSAVTVSAGAVFGTGTTIPGATAAASTIYTVSNEFSMATPTPEATAVIDFSSALTTFTTGIAPNTTSGLTKIDGPVMTLVDTPKDISVTLTPQDKLVLTVNGPMSGVSRICFNDATCAAVPAGGAANPAALTIVPASNTATLNIPLATVNGPAPVSGALTFVFDGTTGLSARTYTVTTALDFAAANEQDRTLLNAVPYLALTLNSTQYYVPLVKFNTVSDTFIKLQSKNSSTGTNGVSVQCLATDGTMVTVTPAPASITPGTAYVLQGSQLASLVAAAGKTVDPNGFAAIITINTPNADTFAYAKLVDPNGTTRVPVKTVYSANQAQIVE